MVRPRRIAALTGIRSEYDLLFASLKAIHERADLELQVIATGAHLASRFGLTVLEIERDGFPIVDRIESLLDSDSPGSRARSAGLQLAGIVPVLERLLPDVLLVCGDREEAIVGALAGAYMNIAVAHLAGGDLVVGNVDDSVRHAVTKLAHLHFPFSEESAERIRRLGEEPWRIHRVGNPGLDRLRLLPELSREALSQRLAFDLTVGPVILLIQHVISSEVPAAGVQMRTTLEAIAELGHRTLVGYPNSDAGSREIIAVIEEYAAAFPFIKVYRNLPRLEFVNLLRTADVLVGNSSLGILEAPFLKLPVVNIGNRQKQRQHAANVLFVPHEREAIRDAVTRALHNEEFRSEVKNCENPFGDGRAGERVAAVLAELAIDRRLLVKRWTF
jgi:GDP/UDP-N,N'-diacetylbacillosamine 2-epimerase (hydrolysing)